MTSEEKELLYDLLTKKAVYGLDSDEDKQLGQFEPDVVEAEFRSLELAAAAISMASLEIEPLPDHLVARILESAPDQASSVAVSAQTEPQHTAPVYTAADIFDRKPRRSVFAWLGWGVAAVLLVVLSLDLYRDRVAGELEQAHLTPPPVQEQALTPAQQREQLLRSAPDAMKVAWSPGNVKNMQVSGDIVWSDSKQSGYMLLRGLPVNDAARMEYQLWIVDPTQEHPIDGGVFDVSSSGEVIIPITPKLHAAKPTLFAVTMEKPGGVVVSKQDKVAAAAKVETLKT